MAVVLLNSLASKYQPSVRTVYQIDGDDTALITYLEDYAGRLATGGYAVDHTGAPLLTWLRYVYDPDTDTSSLGSETGSLALPATGGYVLAPGAVDPAAPEVFDPTGWWPCDETGAPLDARDLQSSTRTVSTKVAVGRTVLASGTYLTGDEFDLTVTFDTAAPATPDSGWVQIQPSLAWMGRTTAVIEDGTLTDSGCTITVHVLNTIAPTSGSPIVYEVVSLCTTVT